VISLRDSVLVGSSMVSLLSVAASIWTWKRGQDATRLQAQMERFFLFEGKLAEWPEAFHFYDIDLEAARREGVTEKQIAYLVLAIDQRSHGRLALPARSSCVSGALPYPGRVHRGIELLVASLEPTPNGARLAVG
jgi:hypothetical protein